MVIERPTPMQLNPATRPVSQYKPIDPRHPLLDSDPRDISSRSGNRILVKAMSVGYIAEKMNPLRAKASRASPPLPCQISKSMMFCKQSMASTILVCFIESVNLLQFSRPRTMIKGKTAFRESLLRPTQPLCSAL